VVKKQKRRDKHIPQRTCVGCRQVLSKRELMRIIRTPEGIRYDPTGKADGRGAYLHNKRSCWEYALKGGLAKTLRTKMNGKDRNHLTQIMDSLPKEENSS
jgi:predicted RNA-binding protein YlxR (DUF448 family)